MSVRLRLGETELQAEVTVPRGAMTTVELVPVLQGFVDAATDIGVKDVEARGKTLSCRAGCTACCYQLIPVSEPEARFLAALVAALPEDRRAVVRQRFADAVARLSEGGLLDRAREAADPDARREAGLEYLRRWVACPFLEDDLCSIRAHRPLSCREHLVTSPAERCADPGLGAVEPVPLPAHFSRTLYTFGDGKGADAPRWLPLVLALDATTREPARLPGPELLKNFLRKAAGD